MKTKIIYMLSSDQDADPFSLPKGRKQLKEAMEYKRVHSKNTKSAFIRMQNQGLANERFAIENDFKIIGSWENFGQEGTIACLKEDLKSWVTTLKGLNVKAIIVSSFDRISKCYPYLLAFASHLKENHNVIIYSVKEPHVDIWEIGLYTRKYIFK